MNNNNGNNIYFEVHLSVEVMGNTHLLSFKENLLYMDVIKNNNEFWQYFLTTFEIYFLIMKTTISQ